MPAGRITERPRNNGSIAAATAGSIGVLAL